MNEQKNNQLSSHKKHDREIIKQSKIHEYFSYYKKKWYELACMYIFFENLCHFNNPLRLDEKRFYNN